MPRTFIRSVSGLLNFRRFIKANFVIYCEGGSQNIDVHSALGGTYNESAEDRTFWDSVLRMLGFQDIHLKPLGSARHVIDIAEYVIANNIPGNLAIVDRDFPGRKKVLNDPRVLRSYGYSWENDVVVPKTVAVTAVNILHLDHGEMPNLEQEFYHLLRQLVKLARWPILLQLSTTNPDCDFVPTDNSLGGCIVAVGGTVALNARSLRDRIRRNKARFVASGSRNSTAEAERHIPGHALMGLGYAFISTKSIVRPAFRPSRASFAAMMLHNFAANPRSYMRREAITYYQTWARGVI